MKKKAVFVPGCPMVNPDVDVLGFQKNPVKEAIDMEKAMEEALSLASSADKIILALGDIGNIQEKTQAEPTLPSPPVR